MIAFGVGTGTRFYFSWGDWPALGGSNPEG